jgi:hypothetical protein
MSVEKPTYDLQIVLDLACAADRVNSGYVKTLESIYSTDGLATHMGFRIPNRELMLFTLGEIKVSDQSHPESRPFLLCTNMADRELALDIKKFFRRLMFTAIEGGDQFRTDLNSVLGSDTIASNKFGFVACLPSMYRREYAKVKMDKLIKTLSEGYLGELNQKLLDQDCDILEVSRSKNYDAWNVSAIINNYMVSWMSKKELKLGPCVVISANIKDFGTHWRHQNPVTRLNYVKAFQ